MTVRSTMLGRQEIAAAGSAVLFTCPAGWRTIVKDIQYSLGAGSTGTANVWFVPLSGMSALFLFTDTFQTHGYGAWNGWTVMNAGDQIFANAVGNPIRYWCSGTLLRLTGAEAPTAATLPAEPPQAQPPYYPAAE